jgi:CRISPR-associated protein Cas8b/Csh1 subtype I-B
VKLDWFNEFEDHYIQTERGRGVFLAGVLIGYMARCQVGKEDDTKKAPLFKQLDFGRMDLMRLKRQLARVPQLISAYEGMQRYSYLINQLAAEVGRLILSGSGELGVDGNFAFTVGFGNASDYFWKIFGKKSQDGQENKEGGTDNGIQE